MLAKVVLSRCLVFDRCGWEVPCRWDGRIESNSQIQQLAGELDFVPLCPEFDIGLGCPRPRIRLVRSAALEAQASIQLVQPQTGRDITHLMSSWSDEIITGFGSFPWAITVPDGAVLKYKSPSCGLSNVRVYDDVFCEDKDSQHVVGFHRGLFASALFRWLPNLPMVDDRQLAVPAIRERWLVRVRAVRLFKEQLYMADQTANGVSNELCGGGPGRQAVLVQAIERAEEFAPGSLLIPQLKELAVRQPCTDELVTRFFLILLRLYNSLS